MEKLRIGRPAGARMGNWRNNCSPPGKTCEYSYTGLRAVVR
jgi:hypothetical protein